MLCVEIYRFYYISHKSGNFLFQQVINLVELKTQICLLDESLKPFSVLLS